MNPCDMDFGRSAGAEAPPSDLFKQGQPVYGQDGETYEFSHAVEDSAFVHPTMLVQYGYGDRVDEEEIAADHLVRRPMATLSGKPWTHKIEVESARLLTERKAELDALNLAIGAARTEIARGKRELDEYERQRKVEMAALERRYAWIKEYRRMVGDRAFFVLGECSAGIPVEHSIPSKLVLRADEDGNWNFRIGYHYDDESGNVRVFESEQNMQNFVTTLFHQKRKDLNPEEELRWKARWGHLPLSKAARALVEERQQAEVAAARKRAEELRKEAVRLDAEADTGVVTPSIPTLIPTIPKRRRS